MKIYSVMRGDGKGYYCAGHADISFALRALDFAQQHDPKAHIVEDEIETPQEKIERLKSELEQVKTERDRYWNCIKDMGCETCSGECAKCKEEGHKRKRESGRVWVMYEGYSFLVDLMFPLSELPNP